MAQGDGGEDAGRVKTPNPTDANIEGAFRPSRTEQPASLGSCFLGLIEDIETPVIVHSETGATLAVSAGFTIATGYRRDDVPRLHDWLAHPASEDDSHVMRFLETLFRPDRPDCIYCAAIRTRRGDELWWQLSAAPPRRLADGARCCVINARDIRSGREGRAAAGLSEAQIVAQLEELASLYRKAPVGLCLFDRNLKFLRINSILADINGLPPVEHIGRTLREVVPALADAAEPLLRRVLVEGAPLRDISLSGTTAREPNVVRHWREDYYPVKAGDGSVRAVGAIVFDVSEQKRIEAELRERDERLRLALAASKTGTFRWTVSDDRLETDESLDRLLRLPLGRSPRTLGDFLNCLAAEDRLAVGETLRGAAHAGGDVAYDFRVPTAGSSPRWLAARCRAFLDGDGRPAHLTGACVDITERKESEERLTLLVAELNHRVRNTLAAVQSIAIQTIGADGSPASVSGSFIGRLHAMACAHTLLADADWQGADLADVVRSILASDAERNPERIRLAGAPVRLTPRAAVCLGMVLHELATNAGRYGALSVPRGRVSIAWSLVEEGTANLSLHWQEAGGPAAVPPKKEGFGLTFTRRSVGHDLGGSAEVDFAAEGLSCLIRFPAKDAVSAT